MTVPRLALSQSTSISNNSSSSESINKTVLPLVNQNYAATETKQLKSSTTERVTAKNLSIAGSLQRFSKISRKAPLKTYSNSTDSRQSTTLSVLPHYNKYNESNNAIGDSSFPKSPSSLPQRTAKPSNIIYNASESGEGSLLPTLTTSSNSSRISIESSARTTNKQSNSFANSIRSVSSPRRILSSSISSVWSSNSKKSNEELPLHMHVNPYDKPLGNGSEEKPKFSLRSRRARISSYDKDDFEQHGYASLDSNSYMTRNNSTGGIGGWLPWNTSTSYSDCSTSSRHKIGKRWNGNNQEFILPLTSTPSMFLVGGRRSNVQSYVKAIPQSHWIQTIIVLLATSLVWHSYQRTQTIQNRLEIFHDKESLSLLHLKTVEQHLVHLHENVIRLNDVAIKSNNDSASDNDTEQNDSGSKKVAVDADLIRVQTQQLYQMEDELDHELRSLQSKIQHVARSSIVNAYGEGPVQVILELNFQDADHLMSNTDHKTISVLLWYDTPHAAWTWLQQIRSGRWKDATFRIGKGSLSIDATPINQDQNTDQNFESPDHLKFIEKSKKTHEPWTIGLTQTENGLGMFINLQDNSVLRKNDVCVGKIIDGFDALQLLVDSSRRLHGTDRAVTIKNAFATHLARGQSQGIETIF